MRYKYNEMVSSRKQKKVICLNIKKSGHTWGPVEEVLRFLKLNFLCERSSGAQPESAPVSDPRSSSLARGMCLQHEKII